MMFSLECLFFPLFSIPTHLLGAGILQKFNDGSQRVPAHNGIVHDNDPFAGEILAQCAELLRDGQLTQSIAGLNERAPDVRIFDQHFFVGYSTLKSERRKKKLQCHCRI